MSGARRGHRTDAQVSAAARDRRRRHRRLRQGHARQQLARHFGFAHLDSGALYRLVALGVLEADGDPAERSRCAARPRAAIDLNRAGDPRHPHRRRRARRHRRSPPSRRCARRCSTSSSDFAAPAARRLRRGDRRARHRHRDLPRCRRQALCRCAARGAGPPPLAGTQGHGHPPRPSRMCWRNSRPATPPTKPARFRP